MTRRFIGVHYSPWSEKARWALDHHNLAYVTSEYRPLRDELRLRLRLRQLHGRISVPVLIDDDTILTDSWNIARYADRIGTRQSLFPPGCVETIRRWNVQSEKATADGRSKMLCGFERDRNALIENVPGSDAGAIKVALATLGVRVLRRKYAKLVQTGSLTQALDDMSDALDQGRSTYLVDGAFSYADISALYPAPYQLNELSSSARIRRRNANGNQCLVPF